MEKIINKVYDRFKVFIKENYKSIIFLILFACFCFYDTGYSIYKPGGTINASTRISGDNLYISDGSFNMAYVSMMEGKLPFYLVAKILPSWELVENNELTVSADENIDDVLKRDQLYYKEAISSAMYVAFNNANVDYDIKNNNYYIIYKTEENDSDLKIGDEIISYDDITITDVSSFIDYIKSKNENDVITIKYLRDNKEYSTTSTIYEDENNLYIGLSIINIKEIKSEYNIEIKSKDSESGPSGGLITALAIYNSLTKEDLTHGKKIVGTGTIDANGVVGKIGSVEYKLAAAVRNRADIFLCPKDNYDDAIKYAKEKKYDIIIKDIETFTDAIDYLSRLEKE